VAGSRAASSSALASKQGRFTTFETAALPQVAVGPSNGTNGVYTTPVLLTAPTTGVYDLTWEVNAYDETNNDGGTVLIIKTGDSVLVWQWADIGSAGFSSLAGAKYVTLAAGAEIKVEYINYAKHAATFGFSQWQPDYVQIGT
jgi:hypothetical protein